MLQNLDDIQMKREALHRHCSECAFSLTQTEKNRLEQWRIFMENILYVDIGAQMELDIVKHDEGEHVRCRHTLSGQEKTLGENVGETTLDLNALTALVDLALDPADQGHCRELANSIVGLEQEVRQFLDGTPSTTADSLAAENNVLRQALALSSATNVQSVYAHTADDLMELSADNPTDQLAWAMCQAHGIPMAKTHHGTYIVDNASVELRCVNGETVMVQQGGMQYNFDHYLKRRALERSSK